MSVSEAAWPELPARLAPAMREALPALSAEIVEAIVEAVPAYRRPLRGEFAQGIQLGVDQSLRRFVDLVEDPTADITQMHDVVRRLGAAEQRAGRSLEALQSAYRVGTRISWQSLGRVASSGGCEPAEVQQLAEALFLYIDRLADLTVEGYAGAQAEQAGERARRRRAAVHALLAQPQDVAALADAAREAGWQVPDRLAVAVVADEAAALRVARQLGPRALVAGYGTDLEVVVIWPDPDGPGRATELRTVLAEAKAPAGIGTGVEPAEAHRSLLLARRCLRLGGRGVLGDGPWSSDDHLAAVALGAAELELEELARARLAPFATLRPAAATRLQDTLLAWLAAAGHRPTVALMLHIHPQTVRYRMGQLRELLGETLDDPDARFELELALRARALGV
ncbi:MAG: helix-turn-helix domain-containing protein [Solirubrobacteraceae bacterium]|nr:helix-turn-helix domain-containing protein [Solirubrobacteraceae bacterium]